MLGKKQLEESITIDAPVHMVFAILDDSSHLVQWSPAIKKVIRFNRDGEHVGAIRQCKAVYEGREGTTLEEVIQRQEGRSLTYRIIEENFGLLKIVKGYGFRTSLKPIGPDQTQAKIEVYYKLASPLFGLMSKTVHHSATGFVKDALAGLKAFAENRCDEIAVETD